MDNYPSLLRKIYVTGALAFKKLPFKALSFTCILGLISLIVNAQNADDKVQMAYGMRSNGKIYVVVAVLLTVLAGLILYMVRLDKKISRLERQVKN